MQYLNSWAQVLGLRNRATGVYLITALSGLVDAACFIGLGHVFAEMMTGNLLMLGFSLGVHGITSNVDRYFLVIGCYVVGVIAGSRILKNKNLWKEFALAVLCNMISRQIDRAPAWSLAVVAMFSVQLGATIAIKLFP